MTNEELKEERKKFKKRLWIKIAGKLLDRDLNFDEENKRWYFDDINKIYNIEQVTNVEILEEEHGGVITKTSGKDKRKVSIGKGIVGGIILGPAGAIIGGTQGKVKKNSTSLSEDVVFCDSLSVKISIKDEEPLILPLISEAINKKEKQYTQQLKMAQTILNEFETLAGHQFGIVQEEIAQKDEHQADDKYSKLIKLKELLDNNIITQDEFNNEKEKILNQS